MRQYRIHIRVSQDTTVTYTMHAADYDQAYLMVASALGAGERILAIEEVG